MALASLKLVGVDEIGVLNVLCCVEPTMLFDETVGKIFVPVDVECSDCVVDGVLLLEGI